MAPIAPANVNDPADYFWTSDIEFSGDEYDNLITKDGFQTLLENTYDLRLSKSKRPSYARNRNWLYAIWKKDPHRPKEYCGTEAAWKHEIGYRKDSTSQWRRHPTEFCVYSVTGSVKAPHTPVEDMYHILTSIHRKIGHHGRDVFYDSVRRESASITKDFCNSFVNVCCPKAKHWAQGSVARNWLPQTGKNKERDAEIEDIPEEAQWTEFEEFEAGKAVGGSQF